MHIIIDIRSRHPEDVGIIQYAINFGKKWKKFSPHDTITFLIFEQQEAPIGERFHRVKPSFWFAPSVKIVSSSSKNEVFRCLNFSRYAPYDPSIPTLSHIFDMGRWLYDSETNANILRRKEREFEIKKLIKNSSHFIVPSFFSGNELVELWNVHESLIDISPFLSMEKGETDENIFNIQNLPTDFFLYDATFGAESNMEKFLQEFSQYIHESNGKNSLVLHGNSAKYIKNLAEIIKKYKLEGRVYITGNLDIQARETLYSRAKAWIFIGNYNTSKVNLALADAYSLPLILSDIPAFDLYAHAYKIHPNHLEKLSDVLTQFDKKTLIFPQERLQFGDENILQKYRLLLSQNKKLSKK